MTKKVTIIILVFLTTINQLFGQREVDFEPIPNSFNLDSSNENCLVQMKKALQDFNSNDYILQLEKPGSFSNTQKRVLKLEYNIEAEFPEIYFESCYNYYLKKLINRKYGFDLISKTRNKADSLDKVGLGNRLQICNYKGGVIGYLMDNLSKKEHGILKNKYGNQLIDLHIEIDKKGVCSVLRIYQANRGRQIIEPLILKHINGKKLFSPKLVDGKPVKINYVIPFRFKGD